MSTRHAEPGGAFRQERWASSAEHEKGLLANLVAKRCEKMDDPKVRRMIWELQYLSWQDGGLAKVASELIDCPAGKIGSKSMIEIGMEPERIYDADQVSLVRDELFVGKDRFLKECYLLRGEAAYCGKVTPVGYCVEQMFGREDSDDPEVENIISEAESHPASYPSTAFMDHCLEKADARLEEALQEFCLNPGWGLNELRKPWFHALPECLAEYLAKRNGDRLQGMAATEIMRKVHEELDYALVSKSMIIIEGQSRTGKTFSAQAWCEAHPGQARYVQVPSSNDRKTFFLTLARAIGCASGIQYTSQQLSLRVEEALQKSKLLVVLDEGHFLFPNVNLREAMPERLQWVMTALVNYGVPVAIVTTPQFFRTQSAVEKHSAWNADQFLGRVSQYTKLPDALGDDDLAAVARAFLPEGDAKSIKVLVAYAKASAKYLAGIEALAKRAAYLANKDGRSKPCFSDVKRAVEEGVIPSDSALAKSLSAGVKPGRRAVSRVDLPRPAGPVQAVCNEATGPLQRGRNGAAEAAITGRRRTNLPAGNDAPEIANRLRSGRQENDFAALVAVEDSGE